MIFETTIENHQYRGTAIPKCKVKAERLSEIGGGFGALTIRYYSIYVNDQGVEVEDYLLEKVETINNFDLDQPVRSQVVSFISTLFQVS